MDVEPDLASGRYVALDWESENGSLVTYVVGKTERCHDRFPKAWQ